MPLDTDELIRISNLKVTFSLEEGTVQALDGIELSIKKGKVIGVVGESGCGKSVTARSILRIIPPPGKIDEGEILLRTRIGVPENIEREIDLAKIDPDSDLMRQIRWGEISMIFQEPMTSFSSYHTIGSQIGEAVLEHRKTTRKEASELTIHMLDRVGIPNASTRANQYPHEFSGGMRQRAMIAMALACNPRIVIADEPTTALDVMIQAQILELLDSLRTRLGLSVILVTHDLGVVAEVCDSVLVMYGGVTAEYADVDTVYNRPQHPYTQQLLGAFPDLSRPKGRLLSIPGYPPRLDALPPGCRFAPRCPAAYERCQHELPELHQLDSFHWASCHLVER